MFQPGDNETLEGSHPGSLIDTAAPSSRSPAFPHDLLAPARYHRALYVLNHATTKTRALTYTMILQRKTSLQARFFERLFARHNPKMTADMQVRYAVWWSDEGEVQAR